MENQKVKNKSLLTLKEIFTNKQVISALLITTFLVLLFHIGAVIPVPGIVIQDTEGNAVSSESFIGMMNLLSGGGLSNMSIFAVGIGPYITAQIIIQLLSSDLIPPLAKMAKGGERGKRKLEIITRLTTLPFCIAQAYAVIALMMTSGNITVFGASESVGNLSVGELISLMTIFVGGTYIAIFIGDLITKRGVGNGVTLLILSGIVASLFSNFASAFEIIAGMVVSENTQLMTTILSSALYVIFFILLLLAITFINGSIRKIPIQQTGQGLITNVNELPFLPIKLNSAGVIPVIFASSIMTIPGTIAQFLPEDTAKWFIMDYLVIESWSGLLLYVLFIILFTFFYSYIQVNPQQLSENFEKSGKFIPGVKAGYNTEKHITKVLNRVNWIGGPSLAIVAALPYIISLTIGIPSGIALGGTGIIIMVTASLELWNSVKSAATTTGYNVTRKTIESRYVDSDEHIDEVTHLW